MNTETRRLLSINILLQLAAADPLALGLERLWQGARVQQIKCTEEDVKSVMHDLTAAKHVHELGDELAPQITEWRIQSAGRAYLENKGFKIS